MTVALGEVYLVVADVLELVPPGAEVLPEMPLLEVCRRTRTAAATSTEITGCPRTTA
jgi:hypothetical protein